MPVTITVDEKKVQELENFGAQLLDTVFGAVEDATEQFGDRTKKLWKTLVDADSVPGPALSPGWVQFKEERGFYTTRLQRFGRGDSRSYYENLVLERIGGTGADFRGWFVGVKKRTPAYTADGETRADRDLADIAEVLEEVWPIWHRIHELSSSHLFPILYGSLTRALQAKFGVTGTTGG